MKKIISLTALALVIVTSIVGGTLATYTKTLDPIKGDMSAKVFDISVAETVIPEIDIAPSESEEWNFKVRNYEQANLPTEVDMDVAIEVSVPTSFVEQGVVPTLAIDQNSIRAEVSEVGTNTHYVFALVDAFDASTAAELACILTFTWDNTVVTPDNDTTIEGTTGGISVTVTGTQNID